MTPPPAADPRHAHLAAGRARASLSGVAWSVVNATVATAAAALIFLVASRFLGPYEFGVVALAVAVASAAGAVAPAAFGEALVQRAEVDARHFDSVFWLCLLAAAALYAPLLLFAAPLSRWLGEPLLAALLPVVGLRIWFEMLAVVPGALIVRRMRYRMVALRSAVANAVAAAVCLILLWQGLGLWALALSQLANVAVAAAVVLWAADWRPGFRLSRAALAELWRYGLATTGTRALQTLRLDQLIIGALGGAVMVGLFNFASRLYQLLGGLISGALGSVSHALLSSLQAERDKVREAFLMAVYGSVAVAFPTFAGLAMVADPGLVLLFGPQWEAAVVPVQAFCVIGALSGIGVVQSALITSQGRPGWWFAYQAAAQLSSVPVILALMPWGLGAVMVGLVAKTLALWPISLAMTLRLTGLTLGDYARVFAAPAAGTAAMAVAVLALPGLAPGLSPGALLASQVAGGAAVYAAATGVLSRRRLARLWAIVKDRGMRPA